VTKTLLKLASSSYGQTRRGALAALEQLHADDGPFTAPALPPTPSAAAGGGDGLADAGSVDESQIEFRGRLGAPDPARALNCALNVVRCKGY
jgi:hypothetical protein